MKAFITGGSGFIGSHLSEYLLSQGHGVTILDDLSTGSIENIEHLRVHPCFKYQIGTIMNWPLLCELVDQCDVVFHLAAAVGVQLIVDQPVHTIETNIRGTEKVLDAANKKGKRVMIASTSEVYGKNNRVPFKEDDDMVLGATTRSRWSYACSKAIDEFLALAYYKEKKLPVTILRFFNTVGPRQTGRYGMVIPRFVRQALLNQPITVYGNGLQSRSFCFVGDVVEALGELAQNENALGEVYNLGSPEEITILQLAKKIIQISNSTSNIEMIPYETAYGDGFEDMFRRVPDISKISRLIGFSPKTNLDEVISRVIDFQKTKQRF